MAPLRHGRLRPAALFLAVMLAAMLGWGAGFLWFVHAAGEAAPPPPRADGIVVLTGGAERVKTGLELLAEGRARLLLISGAAHGADLADLARAAGIDPRPLARRVTVGHAAASTHGNAAETAAWVRGNGIRSLIVVTAGYHMPRARAELSQALPAVTLYPMPVVPPALRRGENLATLRLLFGEYMKWLAVETGISRLMPPYEARRIAGAPA